MKYKTTTVDPHNIHCLRDEFLDGSEGAYAKIYNLYVKDLYAFGLSLRAKSELIEDAIQDVFVEIYTHRHNLQNVDNIKSYFIAAFRNRLFFLMKKESGTTEFDEKEMLGLKEKDSEEVWIEKEEDDEKNNFVKLLYAELNPHQREALYHRFVEGLTLEEVAVIMKINYQSAKNLIHRSIKKLKSVSAISFLTIFVLVICFK